MSNFDIEIDTYFSEFGYKNTAVVFNKTRGKQIPRISAALYCLQLVTNVSQVTKNILVRWSEKVGSFDSVFCEADIVQKSDILYKIE